jgi:hypothetical protein
MASDKPEIVPLDDISKEIPYEIPYDELDHDRPEGFKYYDDGHPIITKEVMLSLLREHKVSRASSEFVINFFASRSPNPERTKELVSDFLFEQLAYKVQSGEDDMPLSVQHAAIHDASGSERPTTLVTLSPNTCEEFLGIFLSNIHTFDGSEEINYLADLAVRSYTEGAFVLAVYEHMLINRWLDESNQEQSFLQYSRAAKKILKGLIGDSEVLTDNLYDLGLRIAGSVAYDRMMSRLRASEYFSDGPVEEAIESYRSRLCLNAIRATDDDFFVGIASAIDKELRDAYVATAVATATPRIV